MPSDPGEDEVDVPVPPNLLRLAQEGGSPDELLRGLAQAVIHRYVRDPSKCPPSALTEAMSAWTDYFKAGGGKDDGLKGFLEALERE